MNPFYFGESGNRLFGVYQPPAGKLKPIGAVLCNSLFGEFSYAHWPLRALASRLGREGIPNLRFDYYGCGDSDGLREDVALERCTNDIVRAAAELVDLSGVRSVALVGLRLGGYLAAMFVIRIKRQLIHRRTFTETSTDLR